MTGRVIPTHIRFLRLTETNGLDTEVCWPWLGPVNSNGYGRFSLRNSHILAHRQSYRLFKGEIPEGMNVCHSCDNRLCVNPEHLWLGTQSENLRDAVAKGRMKHPDTRGERNGNRKLAAADVAAIRKMHSGGLPKYRIAERFGVSPSTVGNIINGDTWKGTGTC
ncbi:hypothetical protein M2336_001709 [Sphingobium sp. B1D7B]|uniref:HNH endonuclease n=1 Tax=Sphingobium sp. B1D7B TaxID=2940578 RepID=UPI0022258538|nr:HNH endonuclease [Sphingobium sp. B1D7B]MCW2405080.1 hypothetical protein [Sphingobium sp. B1D7B]